MINSLIKFHYKTNNYYRLQTTLSTILDSFKKAAWLSVMCFWEALWYFSLPLRPIVGYFIFDCGLRAMFYSDQSKY